MSQAPAIAGPARTAGLWIVYRDGLRIAGAVAAVVPFERSVSRLDLAPWRLFTKERPHEVALAVVEQEVGRKRVLVEVTPESVGDLGGFVPGFYESPFSPLESMRRMDLA